MTEIQAILAVLLQRHHVRPVPGFVVEPNRGWVLLRRPEPRALRPRPGLALGGATSPARPLKTSPTLSP